MNTVWFDRNSQIPAKGFRMRHSPKIILDRLGKLCCDELSLFVQRGLNSRIRLKLGPPKRPVTELAIPNPSGLFHWNRVSRKPVISLFLS
jgi:hypothetical protein